MSVEERITSLRSKHAVLEVELQEEVRRPLPDAATINKLKREKLKLKDELSRLSVH